MSQHDCAWLLEAGEQGSKIKQTLLGDRSSLAKDLLRASEIGHDIVSKSLKKLADANRLNELGITWHQEACGYLNGIRAAADAAYARIHPTELNDHLVEAVEHFDRVWFQEHERTVKEDSESTDLPLPAGVSCSLPSYWTVRDLIDRWATGSAQSSDSNHRATTTLLAARNRDAGYLMRLTVELFPRESIGEGPTGPFCPDPLSFGLTDIRQLLKPMQNAWERSRLSRHFRGRWRIENMVEETARPFGILYLNSLGDTSAEAATLVALLAASGDPYQEDSGNYLQATGHESSLLDSRVAISASLTTGDKEHPTLVKLTKVGLVPLKVTAPGLEAAIDTVAVSGGGLDGEDSSSDLNQILDKQRKASASNPYRGVTVERLDTIGEALDLMLVTNRYLAKYNEAIRKRWLEQWEGDTGKADADKQPWSHTDTISE
ncbi:hypothetical protein MalM25_33290 [Planctomycetes bacterium MalM25]|nr:hypothetical protein MalM25_33290 [Planctomycetes bacterium MalM25]